MTNLTHWTVFANLLPPDLMNKPGRKIKTVKILLSCSEMNKKALTAETVIRICGPFLAADCKLERLGQYPYVINI